MSFPCGNLIKLSVRSSMAFYNACQSISEQLNTHFVNPGDVEMCLRLEDFRQT